VHPTVGSRRVFRQFAWLGVDSVKAALSRPAHQRVTPAVRRLGRRVSEIRDMKTQTKKRWSEDFALHGVRTV